MILLLYLCRRWRGEPRPLDASALRWEAPAAMRALAMPPADAPARLWRSARGAGEQGRLRIPAMTVALLFLFVGVVALVTMLGDPYQMDFVSYWAAARLVARRQSGRRL